MNLPETFNPARSSHYFKLALQQKSLPRLLAHPSFSPDLLHKGHLRYLTTLSDYVDSSTDQILALGEHPLLVVWLMSPRGSPGWEVTRMMAGAMGRALFALLLQNRTSTQQWPLYRRFLSGVGSPYFDPTMPELPPVSDAVSKTANAEWQRWISAKPWPFKMDGWGCQRSEFANTSLFNPFNRLLDLPGFWDPAVEGAARLVGGARAMLERPLVGLENPFWRLF
jgi:hypothetical protein